MQRPEFQVISTWFKNKRTFKFATFAQFVNTFDPAERINNHYTPGCGISWTDCAVGKFLQKELTVSAWTLHAYILQDQALLHNKYIRLLEKVDDTLYWSLNRGFFSTYGELQHYIATKYPQYVKGELKSPEQVDAFFSQLQKVG